MDSVSLIAAHYEKVNGFEVSCIKARIIGERFSLRQNGASVIYES